MTAATDRLAAVRSDPRKRAGAIAVGAVLGLALAQVHWVGFVLGGALVGLASRDLPRALVAGLAFGVVAVLAFAALLAARGALGGYLSAGQLLYVSVAIPLLGGTLGSLARGSV
ncbi:hypothetical protein G9464_15535 [Halostella sp. JP-L12]|uniref:hypothetical protein n=1 Tax=Halostella TaxID=1843185 RepID=UPI0013CF02C1|nr:MULTISPECIES: hypothetical protein [Halostella]NHN48995.1 hypothetical protein [Halostella sp. JP-L12]